MAVGCSLLSLVERGMCRFGHALTRFVRLGWGHLQKPRFHVVVTLLDAALVPNRAQTCRGFHVSVRSSGDLLRLPPLEVRSCQQGERGIIEVAVEAVGVADLVADQLEAVFLFSKIGRGCCASAGIGRRAPHGANRLGQTRAFAQLFGVLGHAARGLVYGGIEHGVALVLPVSDGVRKSSLFAPIIHALDVLRIGFVEQGSSSSAFLTVMHVRLELHRRLAGPCSGYDLHRAPDCLR